MMRRHVDFRRESWIEAFDGFVRNMGRLVDLSRAQLRLGDDGAATETMVLHGRIFTFFLATNRTPVAVPARERRVESTWVTDRAIRLLLWMKAAWLDLVRRTL